MYEMHNSVSAELRVEHVAKMRLYADQPMSGSADVKYVFQHAIAQGHVKMAYISELAEAKDGERLLFPVD